MSYVRQGWTKCLLKTAFENGKYGEMSYGQSISVKFKTVSAEMLGLKTNEQNVTHKKYCHHAITSSY